MLKDNRKIGTQSRGAQNQPDPNKHVYVLRIWRNNSAEPWHYTITTPNIAQRHHFLTLADAMAFVDPHDIENGEWPTQQAPEL